MLTGRVTVLKDLERKGVKDTKKAGGTNKQDAPVAALALKPAWCCVTLLK